MVPKSAITAAVAHQRRFQHVSFGKVREARLNDGVVRELDYVWVDYQC